MTFDLLLSTNSPSPNKNAFPNLRKIKICIGKLPTHQEKCKCNINCNQCKELFPLHPNKTNSE